MSEDNERYMFNFQISHTEKRIPFSFQPNVTIEYFMKFITDKIEYLYPNNTIEIVENEQLCNKNYHKTCTLKEVFGDRWKTSSFYIRLTPYTIE